MAETQAPEATSRMKAFGRALGGGRKAGLPLALRPTLGGGGRNDGRGGSGSGTSVPCASEVVATGARVVTTTTTRVTLHQLQMAPATVRMTGETIPWDDLQRALDAHHHVMLAGSETLPASQR